MESDGNPPEIEDILMRGMRELGVSPPSRGVQHFIQYLDELRKWGKKMNLVGTTDAREIIMQHLLDSLAPVPLLSPGVFLLDLGSGAGLPGIPIKLALPESRVVLLERKRKKTVFLRHAIHTLGLTGIEVICGSAESPEVKEILAGTFEAIVSRAAAKLRPLLEIGSSYLKPRGKFIIFKGTRADRELRESNPDAMGLRLLTRKPYSLSSLSRHRELLVFERN